MDYQFFLFNLCDLILSNDNGADDEVFARWIMELGGPSIPAVNLLKDRGNSLFKEGNIPSAGLHYKLALKFLCFLGLPPLSDQPMATSLAFSTILNLALCEIKLLNYTTVLLYCTFVLTFEPCNVKALYRRGLASKNLNSLTKALEDFESAVKIDPSNKDVNRELHSLVDQIAINLNGKRVALQFDPLTINKRGKSRVSGKSHVSNPEVVDECAIPCAVEDFSARLNKSPTVNLDGDNVDYGTSPEVMDCVTDNCPSSPVEAKGSTDTAPPPSTTSEHCQVVFTNKQHPHKKLQLSTHAYNSLMLGKNIEFFHPRSGAVLRVRPLTHKTSIQPGTLHDDMSWEAVVPTSVPLPELCQSTEVTACSVNTETELAQEEGFVRTDKKKRISSDTSYASKISFVHFEFEAVRMHSGAQVCHKENNFIAPRQVARPVFTSKKRASVSATRLTPSCRYSKTTTVVRKTKRCEEYPIQFDDYFPPFKKCRLASSVASYSMFSLTNWMSSCLPSFSVNPFENG